ncbi:hypothetical protein RhiirA1_537448 [Rhizophagus irregularis]|uniref:F-box domain-containing protein n=1 Tax=Rhizophagus irregularis TaxID=588596 RepID=A0A2N0RKR7_9GLOM|nr:hypothetical protein RhiirA1_537448 [Rhizophagus irregularis]
MSKLNKDILYLIFEELQDNKEYLASCLTVNKTWCEIVIPILWKNPWRYYLNNKKELSLLNTIVSHLLDEAGNGLSQHYNFFANSCKKPLFNYISFCKHLNLERIEELIKGTNINDINDILNLFINENMEYTHLYISQNFDYNFITGAEICFSKIEFLKFNSIGNDKFLSILTKVCKSIKVLKLNIYGPDYNDRIVKLIENQKKLFDISFLDIDKPSCKIIENSLIKHANTIQYISTCEQFESKVFRSFVNLKILELNGNKTNKEWYNIRNLFLPSLQALNAIDIPIDWFANLIESSGKKLTKISYYNSDKNANNEVYNRILIQAIYNNCPNIMYLELLYKNENILDLEKLLINCQYLKRLGFYCYYRENLFCQTEIQKYIEWDNLFNILAISSPLGLFEFNFKGTNEKPELESLKLFFDNWEGRHPIILKFQMEGNYRKVINDELIDLVKRYKEKGVIKDYVYYSNFFHRGYTNILDKYIVEVAKKKKRLEQD